MIISTFYPQRKVLLFWLNFKETKYSIISGSYSYVVNESNLRSAENYIIWYKQNKIRKIKKVIIHQEWIK